MFFSFLIKGTHFGRWACESPTRRQYLIHAGSHGQGFAGDHSPEKISAAGAFLEANHHSIITHLITLDKKTLK